MVFTGNLVVIYMVTTVDEYTWHLLVITRAMTWINNSTSQLPIKSLKQFMMQWTKSGPDRDQIGTKFLVFILLFRFSSIH